jgi:hypothetical protein
MFMTVGKTVLKNKWLNYTIKAIILAGATWAFYKQTFGKQNFTEMWLAFKLQLTVGNLFWIGLAILLLPLTYQIEVKKWQLAINHIVQPTFLQIIKSILAGTALAFWTPGQLGDYGGRLLFVQTHKKWEVILATAVANVAQQLAIITIGGIGITYYLFFYSDITGYALWVIAFLYLVIAVLTWFIYFNVDMVKPFLRKIRLFNEKNEQALAALNDFSQYELWSLFLLASLKFMMYSFQYYCFLQFFGIYGGFAQLYLLILADYAIQLVLPIPPFLRLIFRGEVALAIWSSFTQNKVLILAASYSLFTLNVLIPSLIGIVLMMNMNILKSFGYDEKKEMP